MRNSKKNLSNFSLRLKEARAEIYTQQQLAEKSGVSLKTIQRLENIEKMDDPDAEPKPLASNLLMLSQALDVTPEYLLFGNENMNIYMMKLEDELKKLSIVNRFFCDNYTAILENPHSKTFGQNKKWSYFF